MATSGTSPPSDSASTAATAASASRADQPRFVRPDCTWSRQDGAVYQTYAAQARGVELLMNYYFILDRVPKGRDEGAGFQTWIRRHD